MSKALSWYTVFIKRATGLSFQRDEMSESVTGFFATMSFRLSKGVDPIADSHISNDIYHRWPGRRRMKITAGAWSLSRIASLLVTVAGNFVTDSLAFVINDAAAKVGCYCRNGWGHRHISKEFYKVDCCSWGGIAPILTTLLGSDNKTLFATTNESLAVARINTQPTRRLLMLFWSRDINSEAISSFNVSAFGHAVACLWTEPKNVTKAGIDRVNGVFHAGCISRYDFGDSALWSA